MAHRAWQEGTLRHPLLSPGMMSTPRPSPVECRHWEHPTGPNGHQQCCRFAMPSCVRCSHGCSSAQPMGLHVAVLSQPHSKWEAGRTQTGCRQNALRIAPRPCVLRRATVTLSSRPLLLHFASPSAHWSSCCPNPAPPCRPCTLVSGLGGLPGFGDEPAGWGSTPEPWLGLGGQCRGCQPPPEGSAG